MIKKYWWLLGGGIILLLVWAWPKKTTNNQEIIQAPLMETREDQYLPVDLPKVKSVTWMITNNIELPIISKFSIQRQAIDIKREAKIKTLLGINDYNGYVNKENNAIGYTDEIKNKNQLPTTGNWDIETLKNKLKRIVENVNEINGLEIEWTGVKYQKILFPRWIEATEKEAQSVEIRGDYINEGRRLTTYYGESIRGTFNKEGKLIKISLALRPEITKEEGEVELINIDEASKSPSNIYGVVDNAGIEGIEKINITQAKIVEVYSNKRNILLPYYWLDGNTYNEGAPTKVSLLVKAEK